MTSPRKYLFDLSFDQPQGPVAVRFARNPAEPIFTRTELEAARAAAHEEGRQAGLAEGAATTERRLADAAEAFAAGLASLIERADEIRREAETRAVELLRTVTAKAFPALARMAPLAEIEAMVVDCLREAFEEPRVVLRVAADLFEPMRQRLDAIAQSCGFSGKFVLLVDDTLGAVDGRLEWADGGAERNTRRLARELDAALERALLPPVPASEPSREETPDE
jgi:flagellar assembly protein FliH